MKESKEIVENILQMKSSDYELVDHSEIVSSRKTILLKRVIDREVNVLPRSESEAKETHEERGTEEDCVTIEEMDTYQPFQDLDFEVSEVKDCFEKKKKRRNYIEFRPDYSKIA